MPRKSTHLSVEVQQVERKEVDLDFNVLGLDVLALARRELLELEQALLLGIPCNGLGVDHERLGSFLDTLRAKKESQISVLARDCRTSRARLLTLGSCVTNSGYFTVMSSLLREKTRILPSSM